MTDYVPTCSEFSIEVPAPKDAENRKVPLDTKVMYNASGDELEVRWFTYSTGPYGPSWSVRVYDPSGGNQSDDRGCTTPLDSMHLEKPDSFKRLVEDIERAQYACDHNGLHVAACRYSGNDTCCGCDFRPDYDTCSGKMLGDIAARVKRLCGDSE